MTMTTTPTTTLTTTLTTTTASDLPWQELRADLRAFIGRRVGNAADVDDLVQRVLLQIVRGLGSLRDPARLHAWVYRTARHVIVDYYRSPSGRREVPSGDVVDLAANPEPPIDGGAEPEEDGAALRTLATCLTPLLARLSPLYREAITLTDIQGLDQAEAARHAGVSVSGMKSRVQRGRRQLKAVLEACCRFDLDRRGGIIDYAPHAPRTARTCGPRREC